MTRSFVLPAAGNGTPQSTNRKRLMAEAMLAQSMGYEPIASPWQGANKLAQALMGGLIGMRADKMDAQGREGANNALIRALTGGKTVHQGDDPTGAMVQGINDPYQSDIGQRMLYDKWQQDNAPPAPPEYREVGGRLVQINPDGTVKEAYVPPESGPEYRPATPQEKQQWGVAPDAPLVIGKDGKPSILSDGKQTVNINGGGTDKQIYDTTKERSDAARSAVIGVNSLENAQKALPGAITGAGANQRLQLAKIGALFGVADDATLKSIRDTETFRSAIAPQVGAMIKATLGSANISNTDREFAAAAVGGDITLDAKAIERLLVIQKQMQSEIVRGFHRDLETIYPQGGGFDRERAALGVPQVPHFGSTQGPATQQGQGPLDIMPSQLNRTPTNVGAVPPPAATPAIPLPSLNPIGSANAQGKGDLGGAEVWTIDAQGNPVRVK